MLGTLLKWFGGEGSKSASGKPKNGVPKSGEPQAKMNKLNKLYEGDRGIHDLLLRCVRLDIRLYLGD